ncbi:MAG TPA: DUF262 domain-containing protein [Thermoanaerobaculia bacterium]|nr:DUF262 domain-containing protein [Thermoanaerobaculia bacterium]
MSVTPRGMSIQEAYREFRDGNFLVNRRYQRKLVWSVEEKQKLADSILQGYPIPLLLLAYTLREDGSKSFEILDGMQRLNAIFSFIENAFPVNGKFFDVAQLARARALAAEGLIPKLLDGTELLTADECARFLEYTLAVTEFPANNEQSVTEVFGRINAYGRQLSDQERRQAGVVTPFANVVRELSAEIRGDVSSESLDLAQMPEISVDVGGAMPSYRIKADDTFWCKQGVLRRNQLRESEDEQLVADLAISILQERPFAFSGSALDAVYDQATPEHLEINAQLATYGGTRLKHEIVSTIAIIRDVIESVDNSNAAFRRIVSPGSPNPAKTAFFAVFMAFFDLCVRCRRSPTKKAEIVKSLTGVHDKLNIAAGQIRSEPRQQNINTVKGLIQDSFEEKDPPALSHGAGAAIAFENALRRSRIETSAFECKQGILRLDESRARDISLLDRIVNTLCGIANIGPTSNGAVFIGVVDKLADKERVERLYHMSAAHVGERYCVGVDREASALGVSLDTYHRDIVRHIGNSKLSEPLKTSILSKIDCIVYRGMSVICIWVDSQKVLSDVGDVVYARRGSETVKVEGLKQTRALMAVFAGHEPAKGAT